MWDLVSAAHSLSFVTLREIGRKTKPSLRVLHKSRQLPPSLNHLFRRVLRFHFKVIQNIALHFHLYKRNIVTTHSNMPRLIYRNHNLSKLQEKQPLRQEVRRKSSLSLFREISFTRIEGGLGAGESAWQRES